MERLRFGAALMLVITYGITVGGLCADRQPAQLIGRAPIPRRRADHVLEWFLMALPIVV